MLLAGGAEVWMHLQVSKETYDMVKEACLGSG
jgi:hypothetical protein